MPHALASGPLYFAGTLEDRLADFHAAFADPSLRAVFCTRGGWGSAELLPYLDLDLIRRNPKPFLGYSDHTALHTTLGERAGLVTFHAPMVSPDFARGAEAGVHLASFRAALFAEQPWHVGEETGLRLLRPALTPAAPTTFSGTLWGGCLALLTEALGTPFAPRPRPGSLLFLEDVGVKPYQWDRMLLHLRLAGLLEGVQAIVFGDMRQCLPASPAVGQKDDHALLEAAILHALRGFAGPILIGLQSGHVDAPNVTLPLHLPATLRLADPRHPELHFPQPAVACDAVV